MNHLIILPLILPPVIAGLIIMTMRHHLVLARVFSVASVVALLAMSLGLLWQAASGEVQVYAPGNWPAPFGIVLVLDRLSAMMVALTAVLALAIALYAIGSGWDARGKHFHALLQFQLMGIFGAFLTGDIFNLFVFFEILLIASYGLMIHGGGKRRLQAGVQYVVYNLLGSTLFLFVLGTIYAVSGTLNMADLAVRVSEMPPDQSGLIRVGAVLLLIVFGIKAALIPLHFWLPATYAETPAPVAALFAVMTKVGAYAILRVYTLIFGTDVVVTGNIFGPWLLTGALITLAVGMIGILGARSMGRVAAFAAIGSMGTLLIAIAMFTPAATLAALYYIIHSTLAGAALFLVVDLIRARRPQESCALRPAPEIAQNGLVAALFMAAAIGMAGMPPLSGFIGKLLVLDAVRDHAQVWLIWSVILVTSLIAVVGMARAGSAVFWKTDGTVAVPTKMITAAPSPALAATATMGLLAGVAILTLFAGPVTRFLEATTAQIYDRTVYIGAVLPQPAESDVP